MKGLIEIPLRESDDLDPGAQLLSVKKVYIFYKANKFEGTLFNHFFHPERIFVIR